MAVVAKFEVTTIDLVPWGGWPGQTKVVSRRVNMRAVKSEPFGSSTPNGSVTMVIANQDAADQFELEGVYEVTFTKVEDGMPVKVERPAQ